MCLLLSDHAPHFIPKLQIMFKCPRELTWTLWQCYTCSWWIYLYNWGIKGQWGSIEHHIVRGHCKPPPQIHNIGDHTTVGGSHWLRLACGTSGMQQIGYWTRMQWLRGKWMSTIVWWWIWIDQIRCVELLFSSRIWWINRRIWKWDSWIVRVGHIQAFRLFSGDRRVCVFTSTKPTISVYFTMIVLKCSVKFFWYNCMVLGQVLSHMTVMWLNVMPPLDIANNQSLLK